MTRKVFGRGMAIFMAATRTKYSQDDQEIFFELMEDLEDGAFLSAIHYICGDQKEIYPNTNIVALIRERAQEISNPRISPVEAWGQLIEASQSWEKERDLDKTIQRAAQGVGIQLCLICPGSSYEATPEKLGYMRREFIQFYKEYSESDETKQKLIGGSDANARIGGWQVIGGK